jgi:hypothetical protein
LSAADPFNDQHGTSTCWTTQLIGYFGVIRDGSSAEQLAATCERSTPSSVGEEAEVAYADQSFGQNVKQKSAQKLIC